MSRATLVLGVGNATCGDDGAGPALVARLRRRAPRGVDVVENDGEVLSLLAAMDGREHASQFLLTALQPDPAGVTSLRQLYSMYPRWCREQGTDPMPPAELGQHLLTIFDTIGLTLEVADRDAIIRGAALST